MITAQELAAFDSRQASLEKATEKLTQSFEKAQRSLFVRAMLFDFEVEGETTRLVFGTFLLFVFYVFGQICFGFGRIIIFWIPGDQGDSQRLAHVAKLNNGVIIEEFDRYNSSLDILSGVCVLPIVFFFSVAFGSIVNWSFDVKLILASIALMVSAIVFVYGIYAKLGRRLDQALEIGISGSVVVEVPLPNSEKTNLSAIPNRSDQ